MATAEPVSPMDDRRHNSNLNARPKKTPMPRLVLRLYVTNHAPNSVMAIANARAICDKHFASAYELEIVDLVTDPKRALEDGIIATPTLLKLSPAPVQRVIGNLGDVNQVLFALGSANKP
jgi:circadian clock protein KaiB